MQIALNSDKISSDKKLVKDKVVSEKDALKIHANYLHEAEKQSAKQVKEEIALRLQQKGMCLPDIAEVVGLSEDELYKK